MQLILVFNFFYAPVMDGHLLAQKSQGPLLKLNQIQVDKTQRFTCKVLPGALAGG